MFSDSTLTNALHLKNVLGMADLLNSMILI